MKLEGLFGEAVDRIGGEPISARMARKAPIRHLDPTLLLTTLLLAAFGAVMVFSTTLHDLRALGADDSLFLKRQVAYAVVGVVALGIVAFFDYRHLRGLSPLIYGFTLIMLLLVLTPLGEVRQGASRWINLGAFQAQPSELAKIAVVVALAAFLAERKGEVGAGHVAVCCAIVAVPSFLIYLEPDLGTMVVLLSGLGALLLAGGAKVRHFLIIGVLGALAVFVVIQAGMLKDYQKQRLTAFLDPTPDPRSYGYNLTQSKIAIASGGMRGKGIEGENTQTSLGFVPEQHTDFIFTAVGEQLGFIGAATLLSLFAFLIWRALRIAAMARDLFGTLIAATIAALWAVQLFVNVGMTMGIMPITGIPLPFISYGGSSLITNFIAVGLLMNVHMRRFL
ncbi:MAG: rod shape-determining protein RodA [Actinomycetota bacterium]